MNKEILEFNSAQSATEKPICKLLMNTINEELPDAESKLWHAHPVWFLDGNPIAGYNKLTDCIRLMFWSGASFDEEGLQPEGSFKAATIRYTDKNQIEVRDLRTWLKKSKTIQWDYKNVVKRKGLLKRLK